MLPEGLGVLFMNETSAGLIVNSRMGQADPEACGIIDPMDNDDLNNRKNRFNSIITFAMNLLPSLRQLSYLIAVSESLNFTQAASVCHVTQSTLSGGIQELERLLDATLVERDRHAVRMTPVGDAVVERARSLLSMANDLVEHAAQVGRPMTGLLRLGAIPTIAPYLLPPLLRISRERHPSLRIALREDQTARLLQQVRAGDLDFALIALPYETGELKLAPLFDEELWLIALAGDAAARLVRPRVDQLDPERMLLMEDGHCLRTHTLTGCGLGERANPGGLEASSVSTLVQMVEEGLGFGLLPEMAIRSGALNQTTVMARPIAAPAPKRTIAMVARPSTARGVEFDAIADIARSLEPLATPARKRRLKRPA
jgi:LysR family hydrogen peroxide-inducible transcriptional activator